MADATGDPDIDALTGAAPATAAPVAHLTGDPDMDALLHGGHDKPKSKREQLVDEMDRGPRNPLTDLVQQAASGAGHTILGGYKGMLTLATTGDTDAASKAVEDEEAKIYRPSEKNQKAIDWAKGIAGSQTTNPANVIQPAADYLADRSADAGAPPSVSTAIKAGPAAIGAVTGVRGLFGDSAAVRALPQPKVPAARPRALPEPVIDVPASSVVAEQPATLPSSPAPPLADRKALPAPELTATDIPREKATYIPREEFEADTPHTDNDMPALSAAEQQKRVDTLRRTVGDIDVRKSAITGHAGDAADEYQTSLLNSAGGQHLDRVITGERQGLEAAADRVVSETGGTPGSPKDQSVTMKRGENFLAPLDALNDHFDDGIRQLYGVADERAKGQPVQLNGLQSLLGKDSEMTNTDRVQLRKGLSSYLQEHDMIGEDGSIKGNAQQAETIRKYLNENWSPANSRYTGKLKDAIDDDVTKAAGDDIYKQARSLRALKARTLEDPKGIAQLVDSDGPGGINRKVPVEKVMDKLTTMPVAQLKHITTTLQDESLPESIKPAARQAISELNAHMASQVADQGKSTASLWNAKGVSAQLRGNSERLKLTMPADQIDRLADLNDSGNYLKKRQGYPGAYIQEHNLVNKGMGPLLRGGGAAIGGSLAGGLGAAAGEVLGAKGAGMLDSRSSLNAAKARTINLREVDLGSK